MNQDNRNLVLAIVCSALLVIGYQIFFELPKQQALEEQALRDQKDLNLSAPEKTNEEKQNVETSIKDSEIIKAPRIIDFVAVAPTNPAINSNPDIGAACNSNIVPLNFGK